MVFLKNDLAQWQEHQTELRPLVSNCCPLHLPHQTLARQASNKEQWKRNQTGVRSFLLKHFCNLGCYLGGSHGTEHLPRVKCCQGALSVSSSWSSCGIMGLHMRKLRLSKRKWAVQSHRPREWWVRCDSKAYVFFFFFSIFSFHDFCHVSVGGEKVTQRLDSLNLLCPLMTRGAQFSPEYSAELQTLGCCFLTPCMLFLPNWLCL